MLTGRRLGGTRGDVAAVEQDRARRRRLEAGDHPQQRGLAAARRAEQREELVRAPTARSTPSTAVTRPIALGEAADLEERRHGPAPSSAVEALAGDEQRHA